MSKQIEQMSIASTSDIATLLQFQDKLLNLVHSGIYAQQTVDDDAIVKFQVNYVSEMNQAWKKMVDDLLFRLVRQRIPYQSALRDHFHKVLSVDFLPFLRINRHQLTQVSLFGFDIYIEPLSAILQILNRIDGQKHILNQHKANNPQNKWWDKPRDIWQSIKLGWNQFIYEGTLTKISLNVYILKQYLKIAAKSLVRRDKQIIFTGCNNLFGQIVPGLKQNRQIWLLVEISQLNNELYQFHPSFNYSYFLSLLLPLQNQLQPVFKPVKIISQKSITANILTPLLFSILRNRTSFLQFIEQTDNQCWIPYLNGLVFGLIINFKTRILEYEQVMQILQKSIFKLGILNKLETSYFVGELGKEWAETRDFFISALKTGYNVGELQTWHPTDSQKIQQRLIRFTKDSLLMHSEFPPKTALNIYFPNGFQQEIQFCLQQLTGSLLNKNQLINNFSPNIAQAVQIDNKLIHQLLKLSHLLKLCKLRQNINCICYMISFLNRTKNINSIVLQNRLIQIGNIYCTAAIKQIQKSQKGRQDLKQVLFAYIKRNKTNHNIEEMIHIFLMISTPKQAISEILSIIQFHKKQQNINNNNIYKIVAANLIAMYCPQRLGTLTKVKTFDKQYAIQSEVINLNSKLNSSLNILIDCLIIQNSVNAHEILLWMVRFCKWLVIPLLTFPVAFRYDRNQPNNNILQSFSMWLISNSTYYPFLIQLLSIGLSITNPQIKKFFQQICMNSINDQIIMQVNKILNQLNQLEDNKQYLNIIQLLQLFVIIYQQTKSIQTGNNVQLLRKIMKLYIRSLQKLDSAILNAEDQQVVKKIIKSLFQFYCPLLDIIFTNGQNCRKWRANMKKICLNSLDINVQHVQNIREFQLPSIRKDKGFLIHNPVQPNKQNNLINTNKNIERVKVLVEQFCKESEKYQVQGYFKPKEEQYLSPKYLLSHVDIKNLKQQQPESILYSKQYLLPALSPKIINMLVCIYANISRTIADLLSLTPSNHRKLTQFCLFNKNKQILIQLGLSKQATQNFLPQICSLLNSQQIAQLTSGLDKNSKKNISDNFNFQLMKQQNYNQVSKQRQMVLDLSKSLSFLLVLNQSNWRCINQVINQIATVKPNGLNNIPSLLLQYLEYVKITLKSNQDYQSKFKNYFQIIQAYSNILTEKFNYLAQLQKQLKVQSKQQTITIQQFHLFKINQLGYISSICETWNFKDFLFRAAYFRSEISNLAIQVNQFNSIFALIDQIYQLLLNVNKISNSMAGGNIICADFNFNYRFCSDIAFENYKITLGQSLESYQKVIKKPINQSYCYRPIGKQLEIADYINSYLKNLESLTESPLNIKPIIKNNKQAKTIKIIGQKYKQIQKILMNKKIFSINPQTKSLQLQPNYNQISETQQKQILKLLYYFGLIYSGLEITNQVKPTLNKLIETLKQRTVLSWELLKNYDMQAYHHIKAILIDQQIQSRKIKFVFRQKLLLPQGLNIQVNKLNRQRYCNLIAKSSIGEIVLNRASSVVKGIYSLL